MPKEKREKEIREQDVIPLCSHMTQRYFRERLVEEARQQGFEVVRWPFKSKEAFLKIGEAARTGQMVPGSVAVLCHAWDQNQYQHECVPAWDFYPVLNALMSINDMIYPHPKLDQLHSEKRYSSNLMAPTRFLHFVRRPGGWKALGQGDKEIPQVIEEELSKLKAKAAAKGLQFEDLMVKQGLSWGGEAVQRLAPGDVVDFIMQKVLAKLPKPLQKITVLLQAKLDILSELRWCMVNGELRSREWKSLKEPKLGKVACSAGYQDENKARREVDQFCKASGKYTIDQLEASMGGLCKKVYSEIVADAGGEKPLYVRVDLLLDKQGRVWLGERESWGADVNGDEECKKMDPTYKELTIKMITRTKDRLRKLRGRKFGSRKVVKAPSEPASPTKRRLFDNSLSPKRRRIM